MKLLYICIGLFTALPALAWQERGNGGNAVEVGGHTYSLDLYENGVERQPRLDPASIDPRVEREIRKALVSEKFPLRALAVKLSEMCRKDPMMAWYIVETMKGYEWIFVNSLLQDIHDAQDLVLDLPKGTLLQAAIRTKSNIRISQPIWDKLDEANRAALVLHEMVYALTWPSVGKDKEGGVETFKAFQDSSIARRVVGFWFSPDFSSPARGWNWLVFSTPDIKRSIPHSVDTSSIFHFHDAYEPDSPRNLWVRVDIENKVEQHGIQFKRTIDGAMPDAKTICAIHPDTAYLSDIRPHITENFVVDPGGYEHEPYHGLPESMAYPLGWMDWDPRHEVGEFEGIAPGECESFVQRFSRAEPFED